MADRSLRFEVHRDERGTLLPIELRDAPFAVRRVFTVAGADGGSARGGHAAPCREVVVLVTGVADVEVDGVMTVLDEPGAAVLIEAGEFVRYRLDADGSVILVLADEEYHP